MQRDEELIASLENYQTSRLEHFSRYTDMGNDRIELVSRPSGWFRGERWFWRIVSPNGHTLATSEMYKSAQARDDTANRQATVHNYELVVISPSDLV